MANCCRCRNHSIAHGALHAARCRCRSKRLGRGYRRSQAAGSTITLPVPAKDIFEIQEKSGPATQQAVVALPHHAERMPVPAGNGSDAITKLISIDAVASKRMIPGSMPIAEPGLKPVPLTAR